MGVRRGVFFSITAIIIATLLIFTSLIINSQKAKEPLVSEDVRINMLNLYIDSLFQFSKDALKISSFKALNNLSEYTGKNKLFSNKEDFETALKECILNNKLPDENPCMEDKYSFVNLTNNFIKNTKTRLGVETEYEVLSLSLSEEFPFEISIEIFVNYIIKDIYASWNISMHKITVNMNIDFIEDPMINFLKKEDIYSGGKRIIKRTSFSEYDWNESKTAEFIEREEYRFYSGAPSFINRFLDEFPASECCGIESLLIPEYVKISQPENRSFTDWQIAKFKKFNCTKRETAEIDWGITPPPDYDDLYLDIQHLITYNISQEGWVFCR